MFTSNETTKPQYWVNAYSGVVHKAGCQFAPWAGRNAITHDRGGPHWWGPYYHIGAAIGAALEAVGKVESCVNLDVAIDVKYKA